MLYIIFFYYKAKSWSVLLVNHKMSLRCYQGIQKSLDTQAKVVLFDFIKQNAGVGHYSDIFM